MASVLPIGGSPFVCHPALEEAAGVAQARLPGTLQEALQGIKDAEDERVAIRLVPRFMQNSVELQNSTPGDQGPPDLIEVSLDPCCSPALDERGTVVPWPRIYARALVAAQILRPAMKVNLDIYDDLGGTPGRLPVSDYYVRLPLPFDGRRYTPFDSKPTAPTVSDGFPLGDAFALRSRSVFLSKSDVAILDGLPATPLLRTAGPTSETGLPRLRVGVIPVESSIAERVRTAIEQRPGKKLPQPLRDYLGELLLSDAQPGPMSIWATLLPEYSEVYAPDETVRERHLGFSVANVVYDTVNSDNKISGDNVLRYSLHEAVMLHMGRARVNFGYNYNDQKGEDRWRLNAKRTQPIRH